MPISFIRDKDAKPLRVVKKTEPCLIYAYGMRLRGFSPGCQPMDGYFSKFSEDAVSATEYHDILLYTRKLTEKECEEYELNEILVEVGFVQTTVEKEED